MVVIILIAFVLGAALASNAHDTKGNLPPITGGDYDEDTDVPIGIALTLACFILTVLLPLFLSAHHIWPFNN